MKFRLLALLLVLCLLVPLAGCGEKQPAEKPAGTNASDASAPDSEAQPEEAEETSPYLNDDLPEDLSFGGAAVNVFGWSGPAKPEFFVDEPNGDVVNDAIYSRNLTVEERLDVKLSYQLEPGNSTYMNDWMRLLSASITAGAGAYDIAGGYSMAGASMASGGYYINLKTVEHLSFDKPWWPSSLLGEATCAGRLYFCSGDISAYYLYNMYCNVFNKKLITDFSLEDPYELVLSGEWTLDKLFAMTSGIFVDEDGNGQKDIMDLYGYSSHALQTDPYYFSTGLHVADKDEEDIPHLSADFSGEKIVDLIARLVSFYDQPGVYLDRGDGEIYNNFPAGKSVFTTTEVLQVVNVYRDSEVEYGILPLPKYDEAQQNYRTALSFPYTLYGIPKDAGNPDLSGAVMECLASESYRAVTPALFEIAMKVKYANDTVTGQMFDIIRSTVTFDFGRVFNNDIGVTYMFRTYVAEGKTEWASYAKSNVKILEKKFEKLVKGLAGEN